MLVARSLLGDKDLSGNATYKRTLSELTALYDKRNVISAYRLPGEAMDRLKEHILFEAQPDMSAGVGFRKLPVPRILAHASFDAAERMAENMGRKRELPLQRMLERLQSDANQLGRDL